MAMVPTAEHACYAPKRKFTPSHDHQALLCLGGRFPACHFYHTATLEGGVDPFLQTGRRRRIHWGRWIVGLVLVTLVAMVGFAAYSVRDQIPFQLVLQPRTAPQSTPIPTQVSAAAVVPDTPTPPAAPTATIVPTPAPAVVAPVPSERASATEAETLVPEVADEPGPGESGQVLTLVPRQEDLGWRSSGQSQQRSIGDSFLYAGVYENQAYVSALRFDLRRLPRGTKILDATFRMTGLRAIQLDPNSGASWIVQLIAEDELSQPLGTDFFDIFGARAVAELTPLVQASDLAVGAANTWMLDAAARNWIEQQRLDGKTTIIVRIAPLTVNGDNLFAWDSGYGAESGGMLPELSLSLGPPPLTPPSTPTQPVIVATLTPQPANVLTVVALTITPTPEGYVPTTPTPVVIEVVTPTPLAANLATAQAAALAQGLPAVALDTPVPANSATVAAAAAYATAVALTTGTFTPVPTDYVTPVLYYPSPPPENVVTAAARAMTATAVAAQGTPTPTLPWNAIPVEYVYATPTPGNAETAVAVVKDAAASAETTGTPTPTPWNLVVITPVPEITSTPTPIPLVIGTDAISVTPTPTATRVLVSADMERFRGKILFLSDRTGIDQTWIMDPDTGETLGLVTDDRIHVMAEEQFLPTSADGKERADVILIALGDEPENYQLRIADLEYGVTRDLTSFPRAANYDPAWSPTSDWIAFVSTLSGGDDIYKIRTDGEELTRLTFNTWEWDKHPTWSPDGSQIAFFSNRESGRRQIWIMDADGSEQRNLSRNEFEDWDPVWVR